MKYLKKLAKAEKKHELLLAVIFIIYLLFDIQTPHILAKPIDSLTGNIVVVLLAVSMFIYTNHLLGILALVVAYILISRSRSEYIPAINNRHLPSEKKRTSDFNKYNETSPSLESEMVSRMENTQIPPPKSNKEYQPIVGNTHSAETLEN